MIYFVQKCNWFCSKVGCHVFRKQSKFKDASYNINIRKLHFQANLCEVFAENEKQHYCGD